MKNYSFKSIAFTLTFFAFSTNLSAALENLKSLKLDSETHIATVCATVKVFKENENFTSSNKRGYVIKISGDESIFDDYSDKDEVCLVGSYRIDSRGFAPHIYIEDVEVADEGGGRGDTGDDSSDKDVAADETLAQAVARIDSEWSDNNISTGVASVKVSKVKSASAGSLNKTVIAAFLADVKRADAEIAKTVIPKADGKKFSARRDLAMIVKAVAMGNDFSTENRESRNAIKKDVEKLIKLLGDAESLLTVVAKSKVSGSGPQDDALEALEIFIVNKESKKTVQIFVLQGTM